MQNRSWKKVLQEASSDPHDLLNKLNIEDFSSISKQANKDFPLRVPPGFASRINHNDLGDPLLRQILCPAILSIRPRKRLLQKMKL